MARTYVPSTQEREARGLLQVWGLSDLYSELEVSQEYIKEEIIIEAVFYSFME